MQEEKLCPKCGQGTLEFMTDKELAKAGFWEKYLKDGIRIMGCDNCQYSCEHSEE